MEQIKKYKEYSDNKDVTLEKDYKIAQENIQTLKNKISTLMKEIEEKEDNCTMMKEIKKRAEARMEELEAENKKVNCENEKLKSDLQKLNLDLQNLKKEILIKPKSISESIPLKKFEEMPVKKIEKDINKGIKKEKEFQLSTAKHIFSLNINMCRKKFVQKPEEAKEEPVTEPIILVQNKKLPTNNNPAPPEKKEIIDTSVMDNQPLGDDVETLKQEIISLRQIISDLEKKIMPDEKKNSDSNDSEELDSFSENEEKTAPKRIVKNSRFSLALPNLKSKNYSEINDIVNQEKSKQIIAASVKKFSKIINKLPQINPIGVHKFISKLYQYLINKNKDSLLCIENALHLKKPLVKY